MDWIIANYFIVFLGVLLFMSGMFTIKQQTVAIVERFGKFHSIRKAGLHVKIPWVDKISGKISLKIQQLDVIVETKTKDNVFVKIKVSVQFKVLEDKAYDAYYKLDNPTEQITAYVFDTVRAEVPKL
ncbi:MAG: SPFH domain-containing protein, partial [Bacteroidota bacterium]